jgi:hypothetical protein
VKEVTTAAANKGAVDEIVKSEDPWAVYRKRRAEMDGAEGDFAKVAGAFYKRDEIQKARRVLANFYGRSGIHVPSLRMAAYWMMQFEDYEGAAEIFSLIGREFPDDGLLALDLVRLDRMAGSEIAESDFSRGAGSAVIDGLADWRGTVVAEMLVMERNRFHSSFFDNLTGSLIEGDEVFPSDIRIVVSGSHVADATYMKVTDPAGLELSQSDATSLTGGRLRNGNGVAEFMVSRALPGDYRIELSNLARGTYQVEIFLRWGGDGETRRMYTLFSDGKGEMMDAGSVEFDFAGE